MKKKILFISHDASRTGAPILLLNLARLLKENGYAIDFLLKKGGPLEHQFRELGEECFIAHRAASASLFSRLKRRIYRKPFFDLRTLNWEGYSLILSNTITNGDILPLIREKYKGKIISYIHELQMATQFFTSADHVQDLLKCTDHFIVPSITVKDHLISNLEVLPAGISLLNYFIPANSTMADKDLIPKSTYHVGGAGTTDWRKGSDLFIHVALNVFKKLPDLKIHFFWKGAAEHHFETERLLYDINKAGLANKVTLLPANQEMNDFYGLLDLFLLPSREDPYPLVVLEAAGSGVPSICFDNSGGATEFIKESGGGLTVSYLDTVQMADKVIYYYEYPNKRDEAGLLAKNYLINRHQNQQYIFDQFEEILKRTNAE